MISPRFFIYFKKESKKRGQMLLIFAATWALFVAGLVLVFNTGVLVGEKIRVQQVADNAVYSGAVWQARAYNYVAYCNRAIVADLAFVNMLNASVSTLRCYSELLDNISYVTSLIPYIGAVIQQVLSTIADIIDTIGDVVEDLKDSDVWEGVMDSIYFVEEAILWTTRLTVPFVMQEIVDDADEDMQLFSLPSSFEELTDFLADASILKINYDNFGDLYKESDEDGETLRYLTGRTISGWTNATDSGAVPFGDREWRVTALIARVGTWSSNTIDEDGFTSTDQAYTGVWVPNPLDFDDFGAWVDTPLTTRHTAEREVDWDDINFYKFDHDDDGPISAGVYGYVKKNRSSFNDYLINNAIVGPFAGGSDLFEVEAGYRFPAISKAVTYYEDPEPSSSRHANLAATGREPNLFNPFWKAKLTPLNYDGNGVLDHEDKDQGDSENMLSIVFGSVENIWKQLVVH